MYQPPHLVFVRLTDALRAACAPRRGGHLAVPILQEPLREGQEKAAGRPQNGREGSVALSWSRKTQ